MKIELDTYTKVYYDVNTKEFIAVVQYKDFDELTDKQVICIGKEDEDD